MAGMEENALLTLQTALDEVLDPKLIDDHRRDIVRNFIEDVSLSSKSLYEADQVVGHVQLGGAFTRGTVFKNTREVYDSLNETDKESVKAHVVEKVEAIEREYPELVKEFPKQFRREYKHALIGLNPVAVRQHQTEVYAPDHTTWSTVSCKDCTAEFAIGPNRIHGARQTEKKCLELLEARLADDHKHNRTHPNSYEFPE